MKIKTKPKKVLHDTKNGYSIHYRSGYREKARKNPKYLYESVHCSLAFARIWYLLHHL